MRIIKVLNTNAVISQDFFGHKTLLLGNGIGFKRKPGDAIEKKQIDQSFVLTDPSQMNRFEQVISSIPSDYLLISEELIHYASEHFSMELNEGIHVSLVDHIYNAVCNYEDGVAIPNSILSDIARFYPQEYQVGMRALELLHQKSGYSLPPDEAGFIAMHFIAAQQKETNVNAKKMMMLLREINDMILQELRIEVDETSLSYYRYMAHLKCFAQRIMLDFHYPDDDDSEILHSLLTKYAREHVCSKKVCAYIKEKYGYAAGVDEEIYLTVHLARLSRQS